MANGLGQISPGPPELDAEGIELFEEPLVAPHDPRQGLEVVGGLDSWSRYDHSRAGDSSDHKARGRGRRRDEQPRIPAYGAKRQERHRGPAFSSRRWKLITGGKGATYEENTARQSRARAA